jgi:hypothetical protein
LDDGAPQRPAGTARPVGRGDKAAAFAENVAFYMFAMDFYRRYKTGMVFKQDEYVTYMPSWAPIRQISPLMDIALDAIANGFRNYYSQGKQNRQRMSKSNPKGTPTELRPGRSRKADGLGVAAYAPTGKIICELLEVTTLEEASSTMTEDLESKLNLLRRTVKNDIDAGLEKFRRYSNTGFQGFEANGTPFIPPETMRIWPLPDSIAFAGLASTEIEWVSYWPTCEFRPCGQMHLEEVTAAARGLVLYKIYRATLPQAALAMSTRMKEILEKLGYRRAAGPELLPVATSYWKSNPQDLRLLIGLGAVALAIILCVAIPVLAPLWAKAGLAFAAATATASAAAFILMPDVALQMVTEYETLTRAAYTLHDSAYVTAGRTPPAFFLG